MDDNVTLEKFKKRVQELELAALENKRLDAALRASEEKYRLIVENTVEQISILDMNLRFTYVSPATVSLRGFTAEEAMEQTLEQVLTPESLRLSMTLFQNEMQLEGTGTADPGRTRILELEEYKKDGSTVWVEASLSFLRDKDLKPYEILIVSRDITKRKQAESDLQMFKITLDNSSNGIGMATPEGKHYYQNAAFDNLFGSLGDNPPSSVYVDKSVADEIFKTIKAGERWGGEVKMFAKDGSVRDILLRSYANKDRNGRITGLVGIHTDITLRKQSEKALQQSEKRIQSIFRSAPVGIGVVVNRILTDANKRLCDMVGYRLGELVGQSARILYHCDEDFDYVGREKYDQIRKHGMGTVETLWRRKDGSSIAVLLSSTPIDLKDLSRGVTFSALDITNRKEAEKEQEKLQRQLAQAQKMESVGRLAGGIAHDFNNMLSVILGNAEIALKQAGPAHPFHSNLMEIQKAAQRSADVTRQLLAFARKQTIAPKVLDLNKTVKSMIKMLRRLIGEDINLTWLSATSQLPVRVDPSQIDQVLANLCVNARDAITGVGKIIIETGKASFNEAYCLDHPGFIPGDFIQLTVSDDGCGMDKEILGNLFEPFFTTKDVDKGTGLGLSTVYGIIKQNNGFINVYSEPTLGTTFKVYLPCHETGAKQELKKVSVKPDAHGSETILLVEDEPAILEMAAIMLQHLGYTILTAGTPGAAINLAREHSGDIHLLMTDVVMPEMNGRDLAMNLLSMNPNLKRLFMSGYTVNVIAHQGVLDEGVNFIQKPFSMNDLGVKVREVLDESEEKC